MGDEREDTPPITWDEIITQLQNGEMDAEAFWHAIWELGTPEREALKHGDLQGLLDAILETANIPEIPEALQEQIDTALSINHTLTEEGLGSALAAALATHVPEAWNQLSQNNDVTNTLEWLDNNARLKPMDEVLSEGLQRLDSISSTFQSLLGNSMTEYDPAGYVAPNDATGAGQGTSQGPSHP